MKKAVELKSKTVVGRIKVLKAIPYKDCMVYIRQIDGDLFMYDLVFNKQIYSSYLVMKPKRGEKKLNDNQVSQSAAVIMSGAIATIDTLMGNKLDPKDAGIVKIFKEAKRVMSKVIN